MSEQSTLSPSPIHFRDAPSTFTSHRFPTAASNNINPLQRNLPPSFFDRRRTSHPHNQSLPSPHREISEEMADVAQAPRPRLEHRASQTIIDLTDEAIPFPSRNHRHRSRSQRPPQLGRSDASGLMEFIDLTEDNAEPELIITGGRELSVSRRQEAQPRAHRAGPHLPPIRQDSPSLFVPHAAPAPAQPAIHRVFGRMNAGLSAGFNAAVGVAFGVAMPARQPPSRPGNQLHEAFHLHPADDILQQLHRYNGMPPQAMPGRMDYRHPAFADRKPDHIPPPPARDNFTRSPMEDMTVICPSCEEELIHNKEIEEPVAKRNGKAPTRKEREEHPFWVVKECGHVSQLLR